MDPAKFKGFEPVFYPRSIAVVGASKEGLKPGNGYLLNLSDGKFNGKLYGVGSASGEVCGVPLFSSLSAIPRDVDYVIVAIPKNGILRLLDECPAKGVKVMQIFSAGFSETGQKEDSALEADIVRKAQSLGVRVIGPNCTGIFSSVQRMRIVWRRLLPHEMDVGKVSFLSQSGGNAGFFMELGLARGIRFNKIVSFGNGSDLTGLDFLEYFGVDPETEFIGAYLEGISDGRRFLQLVHEISKTKPIVVLKGGTTEVGARTAASHTASLGGSDVIWRSALRQYGAIKVNTVEEMADVLLCLHHLPELKGRRIAVMSGLNGAGGGACVAASDAFAREGLEVPVLTDETISKLKRVLPAAGSIFQNPVDVGSVANVSLDFFSQAMDLVFADPNIDVVVLHLQVSLVFAYLSKERMNELVNILIRHKNAYSKPLLVLSQSPSAEADEKAFELACSEAGIPTYPSFERMAKAISQALWYANYRRR